MKTIVKIKFGSHLYGTNTPDSDLDYKCVHIPDAEDILLQKAKGSVSNRRPKSEGEKNNPWDVDEESYSLQEFLNLLAQGQTVAIDMLFAPQDNIILKTPLWDYTVENKEKLLTNKSASFVGYCKTQANKYGIKGSRVAAARDAAAVFTEAYQNLGATGKVYEYIQSMNDLVARNPEHCAIQEYINYSDSRRNEKYFQCCNKMVPFTASVKLAAEIFTKIHENYGSRARQAELNEGIDWKALSHAVRVGHEALELMTTGKITFPLANSDTIKAIKLGQIPYGLVAKEIEILLERVEIASKVSVLRDKPDYDWIDNLVKEEYQAEIVSDAY